VKTDYPTRQDTGHGKHAVTSRSTATGVGGTRAAVNRLANNGRWRARYRRSGWRRFVPSWQVVGLAFAGLLLLGVAGFTLAYAITDIPEANALVKAQTSIVYYSDGRTELGRFSAQNRISVDLAKVPVHVQQAVIAAEDRSFYENNGVSPTGIVRAFIANMRGTDTQGGSTITQQYVKNYYLSQERTLKRKLREFFVSIKIDGQLEKETILQDYLNTIYLGRRSYGIETASQAYFRKSVDQLTLEEGAAIAALIRAPNLYDPRKGPEALERLEGRFRYVLNAMAEEGWIEPTQAETAALPAFAEYNPTNQYEGPRGYLLQMARAELEANNVSEALIDTGGLRVVTTFDLRLQEAAEKAVAEEFPESEAEGVHAGLTAVVPGTGEIVAIYGGPDAVSQPINNATAKIAAGSTIKPFTLSAALEKGISIRSRFAGDSPYVLKDQDKTEIQNEFNESYGDKVDLIQATADSINTAYVDLTVKLGPDAVREAIVKAGIPDSVPGLDAVPTITLGTANISAVHMANGYATFAAKGTRAKAHVVKQATDGAGRVLYENNGSPEKVFSDDISADVTYAMTQVVENGTGTTVQRLRRPAAGKTGTAAETDPQNPDDSMTISGWFAGFTPQLATAVNYFREDPTHPLGRADLDGVGNEPRNRFFGAGYPARTWTTFMRYALEDQPVAKFPKPAFIGDDLNPKPTPTPTPTPTQTPPPPRVVREPTVAPPPRPAPAGAAVPSTQGMNAGQARAMLRAAGFEVDVQRTEVPIRALDGRVLAQDPPGGALEQGQTVTIVVGQFKGRGGQPEQQFGGQGN
jgi:membrane peptidoglycan carboxypeptidase